MTRPRWFDWIGAALVWAGVSSLVAWSMDAGGAPREAVAILGLGIFTAGVATARILWLRSGRGPAPDGEPRDGLTTGEMTAQRLGLMEQRIYELEERLELAERMLLQSQARERQLQGGPAEAP